LKKLVVDDILDGSNIFLGGGETDQFTMTADQVGDVNLMLNGIVKSATVSQWTGGEIGAKRLDSLTVRNGTLGARIFVDGLVKKVSVANGDMTGDLSADRVGSVTVKGGNLTGEILAINEGEQTRTPALGSVSVTGGNIAGSITVENGGNAGSIVARALRGVGGAIGVDPDDWIEIAIAGRLTSVTASGDIRAAITVNNDSGSAKGNALNLVKALGGSIFGAVIVENDGNLGTLQAKHIQANVTVAGKATLVRTELDRVVPVPEPPQFLATITTVGKATVKGADKTKVVLPTGGTAYVVAA